MDVGGEAEGVALALAKEVVVHTERRLEGSREVGRDNPSDDGKRRAAQVKGARRSEEEGLLTISAVWLKIVAPANTLKSQRAACSSSD